MDRDSTLSGYRSIQDQDLSEPASDISSGHNRRHKNVHKKHDSDDNVSERKRKKKKKKHSKHKKSKRHDSPHSDVSDNTKKSAVADQDIININVPVVSNQESDRNPGSNPVFSGTSFQDFVSKWKALEEVGVPLSMRMSLLGHNDAPYKVASPEKQKRVDLEEFSEGNDFSPQVMIITLAQIIYRITDTVCINYWTQVTL